jgi:hypothetical protein
LSQARSAFFYCFLSFNVWDYCRPRKCILTRYRLLNVNFADAAVVKYSFQSPDIAMRPIPFTLLAAAAGLALSPMCPAQVYKWVDGHGMTTYSEAPPPNRHARLLHLKPNVVDGGGPVRPSTVSVPAAAASAAAASATDVRPAQDSGARNPNGMPFSVYIRLHPGMSEGELLERAGSPDYSSVDNIVDGVKTYYYYPTTSNPFTTAVRLRDGSIVNIKRTRKY